MQVGRYSAPDAPGGQKHQEFTAPPASAAVKRAGKRRVGRWVVRRAGRGAPASAASPREGYVNFENHPRALKTSAEQAACYSNVTGLVSTIARPSPQAQMRPLGGGA